jgi:SAM-dependent methyltransferase
VRDHPGKAATFESVVDDYDAARPSYPDSLYDALPPLAGARLLELGAGTGKQLPGLLARGASVVSSDLGPRMLGRLVDTFAVPAVVARAEALPFADGSFDGVCGAQMWHWVDPAPATAEVVRVLRPGGWLALWWNEVAAQDRPWWVAQQERLEAGNPRYSRDYRQVDWAASLRGTGAFARVETWTGRWERELDWPLYARWLRSKSYVQELADVEGFLAAEQASLVGAFPDGVIREPFEVRLVRAWLPPSP